LGGCPFAQDELVGNIPTERVVEVLTKNGIEVPLRRPLENLLGMTKQIAEKYGREADSSPTEVGSE
jgi:hydroxymethylglutaryl-CoA lyase